jgi:hypothetical protein
MTRFSSSQSSTFSWKENINEQVVIQNASFSDPVNTRTNSVLYLSNLLTTQPIPHWTFLTESSSMMIGRGSTVYNMNDPTSNQYLIGSYGVYENNILTQSITIPTAGLYKISYQVNSRLAFQTLFVTIYISTITSIKKTVSRPNAAQWVTETIIVYIPSPGVYTLNLQLKGKSTNVLDNEYIYE